MLRNLQNILLSTSSGFQLHWFRNFTSTEISTALRPFYFTVHPDLFGQYPIERAINESSLQQLSSILENIQTSKPIRPINLDFYIKDKSQEKGTFRLIKINIRGNDIRSTLTNILKSSGLPTDYVESIVQQPPIVHQYNLKVKYQNDIDFTKMNENHPIYAHIKMQRDIREAQENLKLSNYLVKNFSEALIKSRKSDLHREEVKKLQEYLTETLQVAEIRWENHWNEEHYKGCLLSFESLLKHHPNIKDILKGRILVFSSFTGLSLDGHIMLNSGEVRHNWLDFIKNVDKYEAALKRIPIFEKSLSHVLRNIKVSRRKFMPKIMAYQYEQNLKQITTSLSDYVGRKPFPKEWPSSLENFEIVVETEAGPVMVSPTGQFIVPSTIPGSLLVNFITNNLNVASEKMNEYKSNKHLERALVKTCLEELDLAVLMKEDNVTPDQMIKCCNKLLENKSVICLYTKDLRLSISSYYSVLSDGLVCIPWNFVL
ncbi:unnamed protein product [Phyllotreta striolata]|uniref:T-cell activation inhibitor, mitochondrial n=1 Tax=Phyllotreta striolata TaxID=444603 RepID=A0A9N9TQV2_PHYSR|nr:unnamed protein product [Phyllotreta striolata]